MLRPGSPSPRLMWKVRTPRRNALLVGPVGRDRRGLVPLIEWAAPRMETTATKPGVAREATEPMAKAVGDEVEVVSGIDRARREASQSTEMRDH